MIYYGPEEDLVIGGPAETVLSFAMTEVYNFTNPLDRTWVSWNNEAECLKGLDADKKHLGIFNGPSLEPLFFEQGSDEWPDAVSLSF